MIGVPDERMGEVGMAFVVPTTGTRPDAGRDRGLGPGARWPTTRRPATCAIVEALPMNASNKVLKNELRDQARERLGV